MRCDRCLLEKWVTLRYRPSQKSTFFDWLWGVLGFKSSGELLCDDCYLKEQVKP